MKKRKAAVEEQTIDFAFSLRDGDYVSWVCYYQLERPVLNALLDACGDRWTHLLRLLAKLQRHPKAQTDRSWQRVVQLAMEFRRLAAWAFTEARSSSRLDDLIRIACLVEQEGHAQLRREERFRKSTGLPTLPFKIIPASPDSNYSFGATAIEADITVASRPGAPVTQRETAIRALELRLKDQTAWPWSRLAIELCKCGAVNHGSRCQQNLRREVLHLKKLMAEFHVDVN
jgi:hypothetical protein